MTKYVAYYRVSTQRQGQSGLGLEAQRKAIHDFIQERNHGSTLIREFTEVESGKKDNRPELAVAMQWAQAMGATLLIAKLDRLSRDASFLITLQKSGVLFTAADMPEANALSVGIMALVAQHEREAISARTKAALQAAKARGVALGGYRGGKVPDDEARIRAVEVRRENARAHADKLRPVIELYQSQGHTSLNAMAKQLTANEVRTVRGGTRWTAQSVKNLLSHVV